MEISNQIWSMITEFEQNLKYKNRFFVDQDILDIFDMIIERNTSALNAGAKVYRARLNHNLQKSDFLDHAEDFTIPSIEISTVNGRSNVKYINHFYTSSNQMTALHEKRPNIGQVVSIGTLELIRNQKLISLTTKPGDFSRFVIENDRHLSDIDLKKLTEFYNFMFHQFRQPIDPEEADIHYLITQYFVEYVKSKGYDGIAHSSGAIGGINDFNQCERVENINYVFFDDQDFKFIECDILQVANNTYSVSKINE